MPRGTSTAEAPRAEPCRLNERLLGHALGDELVEQAQRLVGRVHDLDDLGHRVEVRVRAHRAHAQRLGDLLGLRVQLVVVDVEARERARRVAVEAVLRVLRGRLRRDVLVGAAAVVRDLVACPAAVGQDRLHVAVVEPVLVVRCDAPCTRWAGRTPGSPARARRSSRASPRGRARRRRACRASPAAPRPSAPSRSRPAARSSGASCARRSASPTRARAA